MRSIVEKLVDAGVRAELDASNEKVGKKIRDAATMKIPWTIVIGQKEVDGGVYKVNVFGQEEDLMIEPAELVVKAQVASAYPIS